MDSRPIGMFDSGVGGLTVLHECLVTLPHEDFVYFGDSHPDRFPYGPKPADVIARFAHEVAVHLAALDVKLIVVACNAATASALPGLQREFSVPLIGVITPEAHAAVQATAEKTPFGRASLDRMLELAAGGIGEISREQGRVLAPPA